MCATHLCGGQRTMVCKQALSSHLGFEAQPLLLFPEQASKGVSLSPILLEERWNGIVDAGTASDFSMWCLEMDLASELPNKYF